jgi:hypothetical protein
MKKFIRFIILLFNSDFIFDFGLVELHNSAVCTLHYLANFFYSKKKNNNNNNNLFK